MSDCLQKRIPVSQPTYCLNELGEVKEGTVMHNWMHVRSVGPNCMKDNKFCGENEFLDDVVVDGDLTIGGDLILSNPHNNNIMLCDLVDVDCSDPITNLDVLVYNAIGNNWTNGGLPAGAPVALGDLTDTLLVAPHLDGQHLVYSGGNWHNVTPTIPSLADLTDTNILLPTLGQHLVYDGLEWVNQTYVPPPIDQSSIMCNEFSAPLVAANQNNYDPFGYDSTITTLIIDTTGTPNVEFTGLVNHGQCFVVMYNNGTQNFKLKSLTTSLAANQFSFGTNDITVADKEAVQLFYITTISKWCFVGGKH